MEGGLGLWQVLHQEVCLGQVPGGGGGVVLGLEKGTNCGLTAAVAKKGGLSESLHPIFYIV